MRGGCCACSASSSSIPPTCDRRSPGRPVYLAMAMDAANRVKLKPQNLLLNLPLARPQ